MRELDRRIATLRLRLAEIGSRQDQMTTLERQFRNQLEKITDFAIYENGDLDSSLSMAEEVDARLNQTERALHHLASIRAKAQEELDALLLTRGIDTARSELAQLEARRLALQEELAAMDLRGSTQTGVSSVAKRNDLETQRSQIDAEMRRLRQTISEASDAAARAVSARIRRVHLEMERAQGQETPG